MFKNHISKRHLPLSIPVSVQFQFPCRLRLSVHPPVCLSVNPSVGLTVSVGQDEYEPVAETAVVGFPHELKGEGLYAFIILKDGVTVPEEEIKAALRGLVRKNIAGYAVPDHLLVSGGVCRRPACPVCQSVGV